MRAAAARAPSLFERSLLLVAFLSGGCALIYESLWMRCFGLIFGNTTQAASVVLATFMGGLLLGSLWCSRVTFRRTLVAYAGLEAGIGLTALLTLPVLRQLPAWYSALMRAHSLAPPLELGFKVLLAAPVLLPTTFLAGATLPVLVEFLGRAGRNLHANFGTLYLANTLGAAAGVFASTFLLVPRLGLSRTFLVAVLVNLGLGLWIWARRGREPQAAGPAKLVDAAPGRGFWRARGLYPLVAASTGFASFALEVLWFRSFALVVGSSVYAFNLMLLALLLGLVVGTLLYAQLWRRIQASRAWLGTALLVAGGAILLDLALIGTLPGSYVTLLQHAPVSFSAALAIELLLCFGTMSIVTVPMGFIFPLLTHLVDVKRHSGQEISATLYAWNTLGSVLGALATGFLLVPAFGLQTGFVLAAALPLVLGVWVWLENRGAPVPHRLAGLAVAAAVLAVLAVTYHPWDRNRMTGGVYLMRGGLRRDVPASVQLRDWLANWKRVLFYSEGREAVVAVKESDVSRALFVNGKADASTGDDVITQKMVAHVPLMLHPKPDSTLVIGWGSGCTVGTAALYPIRQLDCIEIEPAVFETAGLFESINFGVQRDPRFRMVLEDGRNFLQRTPQRYDVIISQPSNPWISGVANLFTSEYYALARRHLKSGGIFCQWFHYYYMGSDDLKVQFHTFCTAFPQASLWIIPDPHNRARIQGDFLLLGSVEPLQLDIERVQSRLLEKRIADDLTQLGMPDALSFLCNYTASRDDLQKLAGTPRTNTDDFPYLEFSAPKSLHRTQEADHLIAVQHFKSFDEAGSELLPPFQNFAALADTVNAARRGAVYRHLSQLCFQKLLLQRSLRLLHAAAEADPSAPQTYVDLARLYLFENQIPASHRAVSKALELDPGSKPAQDLLSEIRSRAAH